MRGRPAGATSRRTVCLPVRSFFAVHSSLSAALQTKRLGLYQLACESTWWTLTLRVRLRSNGLCDDLPIQNVASRCFDDVQIQLVVGRLVGNPEMVSRAAADVGKNTNSCMLKFSKRIPNAGTRAAAVQSNWPERSLSMHVCGLCRNDTMFCGSTSRDVMACQSSPYQCPRMPDGFLLQAMVFGLAAEAGGICILQALVFWLGRGLRLGSLWSAASHFREAIR